MLEPGKPWRLNSRVQRLVAPNPGPMTGPGTNTYILGDAERVVLDPGPALDAHVDAILAAGEGRVRSIICTHTHPDHSPAWKAVAEATGATVIGALPEGDDHQDETFAPDTLLHDGYALITQELTLRAVHTPGHVSNHYCFLLDEEGMLFAGDHIMNGSTVVIIPPGGDMQAYIASLQRLLDFQVEVIAPGHGEVIHDSRAEIEGLVEHRLGRERKVIAGLQQTGRVPIEDLVPVVYDDVDPSLHPWAKLSLEAHLIKLEREARAVNEAGYWNLAAS